MTPGSDIRLHQLLIVLVVKSYNVPPQDQILKQQQWTTCVLPLEVVRMRHRVRFLPPPHARRRYLPGDGRITALGRRRSRGGSRSWSRQTTWATTPCRGAASWKRSERTSTQILAEPPVRRVSIAKFSWTTENKTLSCGLADLRPYPPRLLSSSSNNISQAQAD